MVATRLLVLLLTSPAAAFSSRGRTTRRQTVVAPAVVAPAVVTDGSTDFRSDTVTKPTDRMRTAMAEAVVGDDVFGDDPTVIELEERVAKMFGKEAALFVPSGTQGNLICLMGHCFEHGSEYIVGDEAHIYIYEQGGAATLGGAHPRTVRTNPDGSYDLAELALKIRNEDQHFPVTKVICLENTHNLMGGEPLNSTYIDSVGELARSRGVALHVDGARIWHAAVYYDESLDRLCQAADTISVCLSKALGAPVGSVVVGTSAFIKRARRLRKALGGGMRQSGILAAAGIVALEDVLPTLGDVHRRAATLAEGLASLPHLRVERPARTNVVFVTLDTEASPVTAADLVGVLKSKYGVLALAITPSRIRFVAHHQITDKGVQRTINAARSIINQEAA